jgi:hypothetical protein
LQGVGEFFDAPQRRVAGASLHVGNIGALQIGAAGQFLLGKAAPGSPASDRIAKMFLDVIVFHNLPVFEFPLISDMIG